LNSFSQLEVYSSPSNLLSVNFDRKMMIGSLGND
jgi:hypothetical protein